MLLAEPRSIGSNESIVGFRGMFLLLGPTNFILKVLKGGQKLASIPEVVCGIAKPKMFVCH